ncbi:MAG: hypothetical protein ACK6C0_09560 [Betaproteobacteria bacterium]|jgi:predicted Rossmann fold nucleotide-binding protein DprA/Smf involved in DNA uptake
MTYLAAHFRGGVTAGGGPAQTGRLAAGDPGFPPGLVGLCPALQVRGDRNLLGRPTLGVLGSVKASGTAILKTLDWARSYQPDGRVLLSGFHSPLERECLDSFLQRRVPAIVFVARAIADYRLPQPWVAAVENGDLLLASASLGERRISAATSALRNRLLVQWADELVVLYAAAGSRTQSLADGFAASGRPVHWLCPSQPARGKASR